MKRLLLVFALFVLALAGVGVFRAMQVKSRQVPPGTPSAIAIDAARAADRLAAAISIPTVSWGDVSRRDAAGRMTMFLRMLEQHGHQRCASSIEIPMSRSDTANYLGMSLESVSRACRSLERSEIVAFPDRHRVRVIDRTRFERLAARM